MALTQWQLKPVATETTIASGDFLAFTDEDEAGDPINKITIDNLATFLAGTNITASAGVLSGTADTNTTYTATANGGIILSGTAFSLDIDGMTDIGAGIASGDLFIIDDGAGGANRKTTVDRIATLFAGTGLTASSGVVAVDASQTGITSVGALNVGSITSGFTSIDVGAGAISTTGAVATGALTATGNIIIPNAGTIGSASDTDALAIAAGGVVNFTQAPTVASAAIKTAGIETIWVPATSMVVSVNAPSAGLASIDSGSVNTTIPVLDFDGGSSDEVATFNVAFPKSWDHTSTITARFFWTNSNTNAGNVVWGLQGICVVDSGALDGAMSDAGEVIQDANITTAGDVMVTDPTPAITINGAADDGVTFFNVFRDASDTTNDTYASDARLIGVQIFFTTDAANDA